jgi:TonB-dependent receptor
MKKLFVTVLAIISLGTVCAQSGSVSGIIQSGEGKKIAEVKVWVRGGSDTLFSDYEGKYRLTLAPGFYNISFESDQYSLLEDTVTVFNGKESFVSPTLSLASTSAIGPAKIKGRRLQEPGTVSASIRSKELAPQMIESIGEQDIKRTTSRTTGDVLKRIPGATIMEGKFANIRGMYDRYNAGYLNGAPLPSTESDRKAFSFDIIPASLLDEIQIIKSGTPDLIGDFGGGIIRINTKSIPTKLTQSFNLGFQYNSITTLQSVRSFETSPSEYIGSVPTSNQIPNLVGTQKYNTLNAENKAIESRKFDNSWNINNQTPMPAPRLSYTLGVPFKLKNSRELGLIVSLNYSLNQKYSQGNINAFDLSDNRPRNAFNDELYNTSVQKGGILNLSYKLSNRHRIDWKNLYTTNYDASSTLRNGIADYENGVSTDGYSSLKNQNRLASTQLNGLHLLGKNQTTLTWLVNYGTILRQMPDFRIAQYATFGPGDRYFVTNDFFNSGSGRFFSNLTERTFSASADVQHTVQIKKLTSNIKYGAFVQNRERDFTSREFVYGPVGKTVKSDNLPSQDLSADQLKSDGLYLIEKTSIDLDEYTGQSSLNAGFLMIENNYPLFKTGKKVSSLKLIYGVRFEQFSQKITNDIFTRIYKKDVANSGITNDILPSVNVIAPITAKTGVRMAYYKTVNRPEMRELAPFSFYNFNLNSEIQGNTQLKRAELHNFDFRFEIFPGKEDMLSIGAFGKRIINPIEFSLSPEQALIRTFTYENEKSANIKGIEIEVRKKLTKIGYFVAPKLFSNLSFYGNFALIRSNVQFKANSTGTQNRSLQGQSPYVANVSLFYDNAKTGLSASVNFNKIGSRIAYIGVPENIQPFGMDIYEFGRSVLDVQVGKSIGKSGNLKITVGDIFAQKNIYYQDLNKSGKYESQTDNTLFSFTNGRTVTISYGYSF